MYYFKSFCVFFFVFGSFITLKATFKTPTRPSSSRAPHSDFRSGSRLTPRQRLYSRFFSILLLPECMRQKAICDHEELLDSLYNRLPSSHLTYRPSLPSIAKEPIAPGPRVSYGVNLDVDSVVVRNKDGSLQRYPNQAYAHDSRIGQLYYLVSSGSLERVKALIDAGVNYRVRGDAGTTLLMHACENLRVSMVEYLLTLPDIEINAQDAMGYKALYFVINAGTKDCNTSVEEVCNRVKKIIYLLARAGVDFEKKPMRDLGRTVFELAISRYYKNKDALFVLRVLLEAGAKCEVSAFYEQRLAAIKSLIF